MWIMTGKPSGSTTCCARRNTSTSFLPTTVSDKRALMPTT